MRNEVLIRAITAIDDELIAAAHEAVPLRRSKRNRIWIYAAACFVGFIALCSFLWAGQYQKSMEVLLYGNAISDQPIPVDVPAPLSSDLRQIAPESITAPLEIHAEGDITIKALEGNITVYSAETGDLLYTGQSFSSKGGVLVLWSVDFPVIGEKYTISLDKDSLRFQLFYDEETNNWVICKE